MPAHQYVGVRAIGHHPDLVVGEGLSPDRIQRSLEEGVTPSDGGDNDGDGGHSLGPKIPLGLRSRAAKTPWKTGESLSITMPLILALPQPLAFQTLTASWAPVSVKPRRLVISSSRACSTPLAWSVTSA